MGIKRSLRERLIDKVEEDGDGCWIWTACVDSTGYGRITVGSRTDGSRRSALAHRVSYEVFVGPIPEELELDHLCNVKVCINPRHLEAVTHEENMQMERLTPEARAHRVRDGRERLCKLGREAKARASA